MELTKAAFVLAGFVLVVCSALPAIKDDVEYIPPRGTFGKHPVVDTGYFGDWGNPFARGPFGLFDNLEGIMDRMRKQIAALLGQFPIPGGTNSTDDLAGFPSGFPSLGGPFPSVGGIDLSKGNTTSVTKIINGRKVIINETEYKNEDENGGTFFNVRIVEVAPDSSEVTTEQQAESVPDQKDVDNSFENEIPKSKEAEPLEHVKKEIDNFDNIETFDEVDAGSKITFPEFLGDQSIASNEIPANPLTLDQQWSDITPVEPVETNDIDQVYQVPELPIDLSRDTYVNEILAKKGAPTNPDAEVFFVPETQQDQRSMNNLVLNTR